MERKQDKLLPIGEAFGDLAAGWWTRFARPRPRCVTTNRLVDQLPARPWSGRVEPARPVANAERRNLGGR